MSLVRAPFLLGGLLLLGCTGLFGGDTAGADGDADGDGFAAAEDCDDSRADVNPGEAERCDDQDVDEDCNGLADDEDDPDGRETWAIDEDGDGYGGEGGDTERACDPPEGYGRDATDCDDHDDEVYADAPEVCDGKDNDCDERADDDDPEGPSGEPMVYPDGDGDGFGDEARGEYTCTPGTQIQTGGDCDDDDPLVNPGADEVCDDGGVDENCNGTANSDDPTVDSGDFASWYRDDDGDGYGDPAQDKAACEAPSGYVANAADCDDGDVEVSPDANEVCNDGVDNDCDGDAGACAPSGTEWVATYADATIRGTQKNDSLGYTYLANAGDLDGDGADELAMTPAQSGDLELFQHRPTGAVSVTNADLTVSVPDGVSGVVGGADLTGDGDDDLVVASSAAQSYYGQVYMWDGPLGSSESTSTATFTMSGTSTNTPAGSGLDLGDADGDGTADLFLLHSFYGYLYEGPLSSGSYGPGDATAAVYGLYSAQTVHMGDVDADGFDDALAASPGYGSSGLVRVVHGPVSGNVSWSSSLGEEIDGASISRADFGTDVAVGDLDADGYDDLVASEPYLETVYIAPGPLTSDTIAFISSTRISSNATALCVGDLDGDGNLDLGVGLGGAFNDGTFGLYYGPSISGGALTAADLYLKGPSGQETVFGNTCALADLDDSGHEELAIGAPWDETAASYAGAVYIIAGGGL